VRKPAKILRWMSDLQLIRWLRSAEDKASYQRRLAIWMTRTGPFGASEVARIMGISPQAVWKWVGEYNHHGPDGLNRQGRGGRRRSYMTRQAERSFLQKFLEVTNGKESPFDVRKLQGALSRSIGRSVSLGYAYALVSRHAPLILVELISQKHAKRS
jgi:transposase